MLRRLSLFYLFFFIIQANSVSIAGKTVKFQTITAKDGLSQDAVTCILQDQVGFVWMGTYNGLNRHDGSDFVIFKNSESDPSSLSNNAIVSLAEDKYGFLWIGTYDGLNRFDPKTQKFFRIDLEELDDSLMGRQRTVNVIKIINENNLWCGTDGGGLFQVDLQNLSVRKHDLQNHEDWKREDEFIADLIGDNQGNIWICTENGKLFHYSPDSSELINYPMPLGVDSWSKQYFSSVVAMNGKLMLGSSTGKVYLFDPDQRSYRELFDNKRLLSYFYGSPIEVIKPIDTSFCWIGSENEGLILYNLETEEATYYRYRRKDEHSLIGNSIRSIYINDAGFHWIGTTMGVSYYDPYYKRINSVLKEELPDEIQRTRVYDMDYINDSTLLVSLWWYGLYHLNLNQGRLTQEDQYLKSISNHDRYISSILKIDSDKLLAGSTDGLYVYDFQSRSLKKFRSDKEQALKGINLGIRCLMETSNEEVYAGTDLGIVLCDYEKGEFSQYLLDSMKSEVFENLVWVIAESHEHKLWVGSDGGGLYQFDPTKKKFVSNFKKIKNNPRSLSDNRVVSLLEDSQNRLWVGTSNGLNLMLPNGSFRRLDEKNGLKNDVVFSIEEDSQGNIWFATAKTIVKLDPTSWEFSEYSQIDGVQDNEFVTGSSLRLPSGELLFGGGGGINSFHPLDLEGMHALAPLIITSFEIINRPYQELFSSLNEKNKLVHPPFIDSVYLEPHQNHFTIGYASLDYSDKSQLDYSYQLEGFDESWVFAGKNHQARYTNIPPGSYTFRVRSSNHAHDWSAVPSEIYIQIAPPVYKTAWFQIFMLICIAGFFVLIMWLRIRSINSQKKRLEEIVTKRTMDLSDANALLEERQEEIMAQKEEISEKNSELRAHQASLERIVKERTKKLERALDEAEASEKLKSAFLANMSHEIRTPMNGIVGFSTLLTDPNISDEERNRFASLISKNSEDLMYLIDDMLDLSQIESGHLQLKTEKVNLEKLLDEIYELYYYKTKEKGLSLKKAYDSIINKFGYSDAKRLRQVIRNLLENALKFTDAGYIQIELNELGKPYPGAKGPFDFSKYYIISITDTGIGIPPHKLKVIFDRFRKLEDDSENHEKLYRGSGLGLSISKKLIEMQGGSIWVESSYGDYSTFSFSVPAYEKIEKNKDPESFAIVPKRYQAKGKTILITEDEWLNYKMFETAVLPTGSKIIWAKNGQEAYDRLQGEEKIDIAFIDIKMPVMDGLELVKKIRNDLDSQHVPPLIAYTAMTLQYSRRELLQIGFNDCLFKPVKPNQFIEIMAKYLKSNNDDS